MVTFFPPPGLCKVNLIGDLRVAACNGEQGGSNQLQTALKDALPKMSIQVVSIPGVEAIEIQKQLGGLMSQADTVIVVWFLNELFDEQGILHSGELMEKALSRVKRDAGALAQSLVRFKHRMAVIGGNHRLWSVEKKFDGYVAEVADIVRKAGVHVDQRDGWYQDTMREQRHFVNTPENFKKIVDFFVTCVQAVQDSDLEKHCPTSSEGTAAREMPSPKTLRFSCLLGREFLLPGRLACLRGGPGHKLEVLVPPDSESETKKLALAGLEWFGGSALQGGSGVKVPVVAPGVEVPQEYVPAVRNHITTLLEESEAGDLKAGDQLSDVLAVLAPPTDAAPKGQDRLTVVTNFRKRTGTVYSLSRNRAYTVGREQCGNGIELVRDGCHHSGASVLTALLIPVLQKEMWALVPFSELLVVKVRYQGKEFVVDLTRVLLIPWDIEECHIELGDFGVRFDKFR